MDDSGSTAGRAGRRPVGRPSRTSLAQLQDAAIDLGLDSFTLHAVAKRVGVAEATVYNYVGGRADLYRSACDRIFATISPDPDPATDTGSWQDYMESISERAVALAAAHPGLASYLFYGPFGPETVRIYLGIVEEVRRRRPVLDPNAAYFVASRCFMSALTMVEFPQYHTAGTWLRRSLMVGMEQQIAAGVLPELPGDWTDVLSHQGPPDRGGDNGRDNHR